DKIRLDIDSNGHGIETVTVTKVGIRASRTTLLADAPVGTTHIRVRSVNGFAAGDKIIIGTPANQKTYTISTVGTAGATGTGISFSPAFAEDHSDGEDVVNPGTGLDLAAPLKFKHAANLPFSVRGTGITFQPATAFPHSSNEPVQPLGTGITLDSPLAKDHPVDAVVHDDAVTTAGYQGSPAPTQWFGGPALSTSAGSMVLRDSAGLVVDSLNYGLLVDPWAAEGYQANSGTRRNGCRVTAPGMTGGAGMSAGRFPDGLDSDSNCTDFVAESSTTLKAAATAGATNIKVANTSGFSTGQPIRIDSDANVETAVVAAVGTSGATTVNTATSVGDTTIPVASIMGFSGSQTVSIGAGSDLETATIASLNGAGSIITVSSPLRFSHENGAQVSGSGLTLASPLQRSHASDGSVAGSASTPGAPNLYYKGQP
ncbi:hypothetical protein, partial [Pseudomonas sp.]|uniref:hypothetical protein n=1 Tax=Pseudomonas sp. TaxID=306 RepID=UPI003CC59A89